MAAVLDEALVLSRTGLTSLRLELLHHIHPAHRHTHASITRAVGRLGKCLGGGGDAQTGGRMRVREGAKKGLRAGWGWGGIGEKGGEAGVKQGPAFSLFLSLSSDP